MDELKKRLTQKKRGRPQSPTKEESNLKQKYNISSEKSEYLLSLKLLNDKNSIIIKCSPDTTLIKFQVSIQLEQLKEKNRIFNVCKNLEDAFKIITNLFNKKKAYIVEENTDLINLIISVPNYIDNIEENISFNLFRYKNNGQNGTLPFNELENKKLLKQIFKDGKGINFGLDLIEKIGNLSKSDLEKETKIQKLIVHFNQSLEEIKKIKKDIKKLKKRLGISDLSDNDDNVNDNINANNDNEEDNDEEENENKGNEENEEKEEDEVDISEDDEKEESKYKSNDLKEEEYQNKEDIQNLKEKLTKTLVKINEKNKKKEEDSKIKVNTPISQTKDQTQLKLNNSNTSSNSFPQLSFYKNLTKKTTSKYYGDNNFIVFESLNNEIILVYSVNHYSIHFFDIDKDKLIKNIPEAHKSQINNFRYVLDKNLTRDLLLSVADKIKNIKVWDIKYFTCIINIESVYFDGFLFSSCFLIDEINKKNYIISVNFNSEPLKIFDFKGTNIRNIENNEDKSYIVETFFNSYQSKYYIIVGNENFIISYYFEDGLMYKKYYDFSSDNCLHMFFTISCKDTDIYLIEADLIGYIRIWNFDTGVLLKKYLIGEKLKLRGLCMWNESYVFVGASDKTVKLVDLRNGEILDNLKCNEIVCNIKKINTKKFGECLLLQGKSYNGQIKLWKNIN